jgi:hypothetical protein
VVTELSRGKIMFSMPPSLAIGRENLGTKTKYSKTSGGWAVVAAALW